MFGNTNDGSRHSARGEFNMFSSISRLFDHWRGPKSIAKLAEV